MSEKLLPCPLCGGCPVLTEAMTEHWVSCGTCGASGGMHGRLKLAIAAWNRRTPAPEGEAYAFLGHIIVPKSGVGAVFIDKSEGVPIMGGKGSVVPVYSGPQNVTAPFPPVVPAPEGEVVAWGCFDTNGLDDKLVYRDRRRAEDAAFACTPSLTVKPLYASPVFPVGGGEASFAANPVWTDRDDFEIWQDGECQASASSWDILTAWREAVHYAAMYGEDGPVEIVRVSRTVVRELGE